VVKDLGLPVGTGAFEVNLDQVVRSAVPIDSVRAVSVLPVAKEDIALVVDESVSVAAVEAAIKQGAGQTLESLRLFDVYRSDSLGQGKKSLAFAMKFRPKSGTLTAEDLANLRAEVLRSAEKAVGATLRT
jgi:phenylalanyl-tRNA synthetase beta chain